jgi:hypothetical protein
MELLVVLTADGRPLTADCGLEGDFDHGPWFFYSLSAVDGAVGSFDR